MPNLGDYIGRLLSEITIARMHADLEAVRVAELYASHPLLRYMPVPHFRLPNVDVEIPVAIKQMEEEKDGALPRGAPDPQTMRKAFDRVVAEQFKEQQIILKPEHEKKLKVMLDQKIASLARPTEISVDVNRFADELAGVAARTLTEAGGPIPPIGLRVESEDDLKGFRVKLEEKLKAAARIEFAKLRTPPTRLQALVTTAEIREAGPNEIITRFHLRITEEAFEWTTIESDDQKQDRLIAE